MRPILCLLAAFATAASAQSGPLDGAPAWSPAGASDLDRLIASDPVGATIYPDFLPVDEAFQLELVVTGPERIEARWRMAEGYYLYRDRLSFSLDGAGPGIELARPDLPPGEAKDDDYFGRVAVFYGGVDTVVPVLRDRLPATPVRLSVVYQGCADAGLCYPPVTRQFDLALPEATPEARARATAYRAAPAPPPPAPLAAPGPVLAPLPFMPIASVDEAERALAGAAARGQPALVEFYADWCIPCRQMERTTFADPQVRGALAGTALLRIDVTENLPADRALLARFGVDGPPAMLFFGADGVEQGHRRVYGYLGPQPFRAHLAGL